MTQGPRYQAAVGKLGDPQCKVDLVLDQTFTNYVNEVARTEIDFPVVAVRGFVTVQRSLSYLNDGASLGSADAAYVIGAELTVDGGLGQI